MLRVFLFAVAVVAALLSSPLCRASAPDAVVVFNEVQYNPPGMGEEGEWIELFNQMGIQTDVSGWRIEGIGYTFPNGTIIAPGGYLVVAKTPVVGQRGPFTGSIDNGGERLRLINKGERLMDELDFGDDGRWPAAADGSGATLAKRNPYTANKPPGNWAFSAQVGGTPGAENFPAAPVTGPIVFNEVPEASVADFWVELINSGTSEVELEGIRISAGGDPAREYVLPPGQLASGALLLLDEVTLGFRPVDGEKLFLHDATGTVVLDGREVTGRLRGRAAEREGAWLYPAVATPDAPNSFAFNTDVVISEISYNPPAPLPVATSSDNQWVEIANRGAGPVDLGGWEFADGVSLEFPAGTTLASGEHACVVRDGVAFAAAFPAARVLGEFGGSLSRSGERLLLRDAAKNPVDEVRYFDGGRWPDVADGGGATLELRDLDADNGKAAAWAPSDESGQTGWQTYTFRGVAAGSAGPDTKWTEFNFGLLDAGEVLIDDISVVEDPDGTAVQKLRNTTFSGRATGWRYRGNHRPSDEIIDPDDPNNRILRLVATGGTGHMSNQVETTLLSSIVNGREYEFSFRARWVSGSNQLHTRLYFNRLPRVTILDRPEHVGTPGAPNSQAVANLGPTMSGLAHSPAVPAVNQAVTVGVDAADPDGVAGMTLFYSVAGAAFQSVAMTADGAGRYEADIPGQAAATVVQFYVEALDTPGATTMFPSAGPDSRALYKVDDGLAATNGQHNFRIVVTNAERDFIHQPIEVMSNDRIGATIIDREEDIYYDVKLRLKGSQRARNQTNRVGFNMRFGRDNLYRGIHRSMAIDRSEGVGQGQFEILFDLMIANSGGVISRYYDFIKVMAPKNQHTRSAVLQMARYDDVFLDSQFENGSDGNLYEYELLYTPNTADANGYKYPEPDGVTGTSVSDKGDDKEKYRWFFLKKNNREPDDFAPIIAYNKKMSQSTREFNRGLEDVVDVDSWLRGMAYAVLSGAGDNAAAGSAHNGMYYARPDGRIIFFPHDMDFLFQSNRQIFANADCAKLTADPARRRIYLGHLHDIITTTYNARSMGKWTRHLATLDPAQSWSSHLSYIGSRATYVLSQINSQVAPVSFSITGASSVEVGASPATVSGNGWVDVREIRLAGSSVPLDVTWTDADSWRVALPVAPGEQLYTLEAVSFSGFVIGSDAITINNTGVVEPAATGNLVISELMFHPADPTGDELAAGFDDAELFEFVELHNTASVAVDLTGIRFTSGINFDLESAVIPAGGRMVLARNRAAFLRRHPDAAGVLLAGEYGTGDTNQFANGGEQVVLADAGGGDIVRFTYGDEAPWPTPADGEGPSLVLIASESHPDATVPGSWRLSSLADGNPGTSDAVAFSGDPNGDGNGNGVPDLVDHALADDGFLGFTMSPDMGTLEYVQNIAADDVVVEVEISEDAQSWTEGSALFAGQELGFEDNGRLRVRRQADRAGLPDGQLFVRLRVKLWPGPVTPTFPLTITPTATGFDLEWASKPGMIYTLKRTNDLTTDRSTWDVVEENIAADPPSNVESVVPTGSVSYYVVEEFPDPED